MEPERWNRVEQLLQAVLDLEEKQRGEFLRQHCVEDEDLRREVESLLAFRNDVSEFMETPALEVAAHALANEHRRGPEEAEDRGFEGKTVSHYDVLEKLGGGGMGIVYKARDTKLGRFVALKFLPSELSQDHQAIERFRREAYAASALNHPNICTIYDIDEHDGEPFIAMEFLSGQTLKAIIADKPLPLDRLLDLAIQISSGLEAAHTQGIIHRDIKPANVFLPDGGTAKILDFGLAKLVRGGTEVVPRSNTPSRLGFQDSVSSPGSLMGTLLYMSPEQLLGEELDPRTDLFSFSALLYELATAVPPFSGPTQNEIKNAILHLAPVDAEQLNPGLPPQLGRIIRKGLEKKRERRCQSASELRTDLQRLKDETGLERVRTLTGVWRRVTTVAAAASFLLVIAAAAILGLNFRDLRHRLFGGSPGKPGDSTQATAAPAHTRRSVAVLGFKNLSGRADKAWLSTALAEMLTTELAAGEQLRTVPGENVSQVKINLSLPDAESYGLETLTKIHKNLNTDDVVVGSYIALAKGQVRLDLRLQDALQGETLATVSEKGSEGQIDDLVSRVGLALREKLGVGGLLGAQAAAVRAVLPSHPEAARLYAEGLQRLRMFDVLGARDPLEKAVAVEPGNAKVHSTLAEVWQRLGYNEKAKKEARLALDLSTSLSREDRLVVEANYRETAHERDKAVELYRTLVSLFPDNLDYGLKMAAAQNRAGQSKDALVTIGRLRTIPPPARDDPRIDLAEDDVAFDLGEFKLGLAAASRAGAKADALGAPLLIATAQDDQCIFLMQLGQLKESLRACEQAKEIYARTGDRDRGARVLLDMGLLQYKQGDLVEAQGAYEQALAVFRELGDKQRAATTMNNLANVLSDQGDWAGALARYDQALRIHREFGSKEGEAIALGNIATAFKHIGNLDAARANFRQALALDRAISFQDHEAYDLAELGNVLYLAGDLDQSKKLLEQSLDVCRRVDATQILGSALAYLGDLLESEGSLAEARSKHQEALSVREKIGLNLDAAQSRLSIAELSIEEGHQGDVETPVREAREIIRKQKVMDGELWADAVLAEALLAQNNKRDALKELENLAPIARKSQDRDVRFYSAIVASRVDAATGKAAQAENRLEIVLAEATRYGFVNRQFQARLALGEIELKTGKRQAGRTLLQVLERDSKTKGVLLIARKASAAASGTE